MQATIGAGAAQSQQTQTNPNNPSDDVIIHPIIQIPGIAATIFAGFKIMASSMPLRDKIIAMISAVPLTYIGGMGAALSVILMIGGFFDYVGRIEQYVHQAKYDLEKITKIVQSPKKPCPAFSCLQTLIAKEPSTSSNKLILEGLSLTPKLILKIYKKIKKDSDEFGELFFKHSNPIIQSLKCVLDYDLYDLLDWEVAILRSLSAASPDLTKAIYEKINEEISTYQKSYRTWFSSYSSPDILANKDQDKYVYKLSPEKLQNVYDELEKMLMSPISIDQYYTFYTIGMLDRYYTFYVSKRNPLNVNDRTYMFGIKPWAAKKIYEDYQMILNCTQNSVKPNLALNCFQKLIQVEPYEWSKKLLQALSLSPRLTALIHYRIRSDCDSEANGLSKDINLFAYSLEKVISENSEGLLDWELSIVRSLLISPDLIKTLYVTIREEYCLYAFEILRFKSALRSSISCTYLPNGAFKDLHFSKDHFNEIDQAMKRILSHGMSFENFCILDKHGIKPPVAKKILYEINHSQKNAKQAPQDDAT